MNSSLTKLPHLLFLALLIVPDWAAAYYDPGVQRWINRDPVGEQGDGALNDMPAFSPGTHAWLQSDVTIENGDINLYRIAGGEPAGFVDVDGRGWFRWPRWGKKPPPPPPAPSKKPPSLPKSTSPWCAGDDCQAWLADPLGNIDRCEDCCAEQMAKRQAHGSPAIEMAAEFQHCKRECQKSNGLRGPKLR